MKSVRLVKRTVYIIAERHEEQLVQQQMSAVLTTIFSARKELPILFKQCDDYTALILRLCTATCRTTPEPVNDNAFFEASVPDCSLVWPAAERCLLSPIHTAEADETKLSSRVASAVCTRICN